MLLLPGKGWAPPFPCLTTVQHVSSEGAAGFSSHHTCSPRKWRNKGYPDAFAIGTPPVLHLPQLSVVLRLGAEFCEISHFHANVCVGIVLSQVLFGQPCYWGTKGKAFQPFLGDNLTTDFLTLLQPSRPFFLDVPWALSTGVVTLILFPWFLSFLVRKACCIWCGSLGLV